MTYETNIFYYARYTMCLQIFSNQFYDMKLDSMLWHSTLCYNFQYFSTCYIIWCYAMSLDALLCHAIICHGFFEWCGQTQMIDKNSFVFVKTKRNLPHCHCCWWPLRIWKWCTILAALPQGNRDRGPITLTLVIMQRVQLLWFTGFGQY